MVSREIEQGLGVLEAELLPALGRNLRKAGVAIFAAGKEIVGDHSIDPFRLERTPLPVLKNFEIEETLAARPAEIGPPAQTSRVRIGPRTVVGIAQEKIHSVLEDGVDLSAAQREPNEIVGKRQDFVHPPHRELADGDPTSHSTAILNREISPSETLGLKQQGLCHQLLNMAAVRISELGTARRAVACAIEGCRQTPRAEGFGHLRNHLAP